MVTYIARTFRLKENSQSFGVQSRIVHVEWGKLAERSVDRRIVEHIEHAGGDLGPGKAGQCRWVQIGRHDLRALGGHRQRARPANALARRGDQRGLAGEPSARFTLRHPVFLSVRLEGCSLSNW